MFETNLPAACWPLQRRRSGALLKRLGFRDRLHEGEVPGAGSRNLPAGRVMEPAKGSDETCREPPRGGEVSGSAALSGSRIRSRSRPTCRPRSRGSSPSLLYGDKTGPLKTSNGEDGSRMVEEGAVEGPWRGLSTGEGRLKEMEPFPGRHRGVAEGAGCQKETTVGWRRVGKATPRHSTTRPLMAG